MPVAAGITAAGSIGSALIGSSAAKSAAGAQADAARNALAFQQSVFSQNQALLQGAQANYKPYLDVGSGATYSLGDLYGLNGGQGGKPDYSKFSNSPDYGFAFQQGQQATQNVLSAQGNLLSGSGLTALNNFGQGLASQQYGNYFNRLMGLSNVGQNAANAFGSLTANAMATNTSAATGIGNTIQGIGQAQASGIVGSANALSGGLTGVTNALALPSYANFLRPSSQGFNPSSYGNVNPGNANYSIPGGSAAWNLPVNG